MVEAVGLVEGPGGAAAVAAGFEGLPSNLLPSKDTAASKERSMACLAVDPQSVTLCNVRG